MDTDTKNKINEIKRLLNLDMYDEFKDIDPYLILIAFTHTSYIWNDDINKKLSDNYNNQKNYEYFEYVGDRILKAINIYLINEYIINLLDIKEKQHVISHQIQSRIERNIFQSCLNLLNR